jgi:hypothetical protein
MSLEKKNLMATGNGDKYDAEGNVVNTATLLSEQTGKTGGKYIATTSELTPDSDHEFYAIQVIADIVITAITGNVTGLNGATITAGQVVYGRFTSITLASGSIIAYQAKI